MRILSYQPDHPFHEILKEMRGKLGVKKNKEPWHRFNHISCLCVSEELYSRYGEYFMLYKPMVEKDVTVKVHAEKTDLIPWGVEYLGGSRLWKRGMGRAVKVAVIDTGIDSKHPDLKSQVKGGIHLVKRGANGHGTHVAGIIAAAMNQWGIVGVYPHAHLYDVKVFNADGTASLTNILKGIDWSIQNGMDFINMSFGMPESSTALERMIKAASARGITMVASAGNNGGKVEYPARYAGVIGVGALDKNGKLANFSSRGKGMNTSAPGVGIYSTWPGGGFRSLNGTSMAAPHVTGLLALRKALKKK